MLNIQVIILEKRNKRWHDCLRLLSNINRFLIGGGHDIAYAQYLATREVYSDASIGIINIDAHFDTRPDEPPTSGTMFREILDNDENVDYLVLAWLKVVIRVLYMIMQRQ